MLHQALNDSVELGRVIHVALDPNLTVRHRLHLELGHDTKVGAATLQSPEQIRVFLSASRDDRGVRQNNLE